MPNSPVSILPNKHSLLVPLEIVKEVLSATKRFNMMRVYLYINCRSDGTIYLTPKFRRQIEADLKISYRHVNNCISMLEHEFKWIRPLNKKAKYYIIQGFRTILKRRDCTNFQCVTLYPNSGILEDEEIFNAWLQGAHLAGLVRYLKNRWDTGFVNEESLNGSKLAIGSKPSSLTRKSFYWPLASEYIAKSLGISISTASLYRTNAEKYNFIEVRRYRRALTKEELYLLAQGQGNYGHRLRHGRGRITIDGITGVRSDSYCFRRMTTKNDRAFINKRKAARLSRERKKANLALINSKSPSSSRLLSSSPISSNSIVESLTSTLVSFDDVIA